MSRVNCGSMRSQIHGNPWFQPSFIAHTFKQVIHYYTANSHRGWWPKTNLYRTCHMCTRSTPLWWQANCWFHKLLKVTLLEIKGSVMQEVRLVHATNSPWCKLNKTGKAWRSHHALSVVLHETDEWWMHHSPINSSPCCTNSFMSSMWTTMT